MSQIFFQLFPFFTLIGLGYLAVRSGFISDQAVTHLSQFVFYFALSAMLFDFSSKLPINQIFDITFISAYASATMVVYILVLLVARSRKCGIAEASVEAQCAVVGNVGFLAIPVLIMLFGEAAAPSVLLVLTVDLVLFGSLIVAVITGSRDEGFSVATLGTIASGLIRNPMIMAIACGLAWSTLELPRPAPLTAFLVMLGAAATPCALIAIGGSLVARNAERLGVAIWLSFVKLILHPLAVALAALKFFDIAPFAASIMIATAAMPTAGNVYIIAQHYKVAPQRASASILISTILSVVTLTLTIALVYPGVTP